jgi:hypothetical protein
VPNDYAEARFRPLASRWRNLSRSTVIDGSALHRSFLQDRIGEAFQLAAIKMAVRNPRIPTRMVVFSFFMKAASPLSLERTVE